MIKHKRLVALFDILGFGTRLKNEPLANLRRHLRSFIRKIRSESLTNTASHINPEDEENLETARFVFDSVLLVSHDTSVLKHVGNFVFACRSLLELGFVNRFPFRGSIAVGEVFNDDETGLLLSNCFPVLRDSEKIQDWTGCFVHPSAADLVMNAMAGLEGAESDKHQPMGWHACHWFDVPIKTDSQKSGPGKAWCLNWPFMIDRQILASSLSYLQGDPSKYCHTKAYIDWVQSLPAGLEASSGGPVPPGTFAKTLHSRHAMRIAFVDGHGNAVKMPACTMHWEIRGEKGFQETGAAKIPIT